MRSTTEIYPHLVAMRSTTGIYPHLVAMRSTTGIYPHLVAMRSTTGIYPHLVAMRSTTGIYPHLVAMRSTTEIYPHLVAMRSTTGIYPHLVAMRSTTEIYPHLVAMWTFGINSILYQRGIYPPESFSRVTQYDMSLQLTTDGKLKNYLTNVVSQLKEWLYDCTVQKLVLVITCMETNEITATVTFLPPAGDPPLVPDKWEESGPQIIDQSEEVRLRSFATSIHKVNSMVAYRRTDSN
ncbi:hypothetical protein CRUP_011281 [Coryphaenoides rupestris]|nr:hypothetical protein CRUP_011281 [Coryphaenoides rupestris]